MVTTAIVCAQCGREARSDADLVRWRHGELALETEIGDGLLVCPDCDADDRDRAFEEGDGG